MSNILTPCSPKLKTKREVLLDLYKQIQIEINEIIDLTYIFPKTDELDMADIIFHISFLLPQGCDVKAIVRVLIKDAATIKGVTYTEEQIDLVVPIIEKFLQRYYTI